MEWRLYTDGGSRNNPGQAAIGVVLKNPDGQVVKSFGKYVGLKTNNEAEYLGLIEGLKASLPYRPERLRCYLDSKLVVSQLKGEYRVRQPHLAVYVNQVFSLVSQLNWVEFHYIPRAKNSEADSLVNQTLDGVSDGWS